METLSTPLQAAQSLRAIIRATRQETEATRRLAPQVVTGLIDTGLCRLALPGDLGGYGAEPVVTLQVYEELAWADASVAVVALNNHLPCLTSRFFPAAARTLLFGNVRHLLANSTRPSGQAVAADGGYRVSGRWSLVSGCELADWIPLMCVLTAGTDSGRRKQDAPEMRLMYVPKGSYRIVDTWYVGGLRGTGSHDVVVEDMFVPAELTCSFFDPDHLNQPLSRMPFRSTLAAVAAAICVGIAQAALDTLLELGSAKAQGEPQGGLRDRPTVQAMVAASAAAVDAARLLLYAASSDVWAACCRDEPVTDTQRARVWGSAIHAAKTSKAVVTSVYEAAGTAALYVDCPIERAHRDIHAIAQHIILAPVQLEDAGRVYFGLQPDNPLF